MAGSVSQRVDPLVGATASGRWGVRRPTPAAAADARRAEFEALVQPLLKPLYHAALGYVRHPTEAEDVVQDAVLRAYRAFDRFERGTNFKAWLFRILTNLCINRFRSAEHRVEVVGYEEVEREAELAGSQQGPPSGAPEVAVFDQLLDEEIQEAIAALSPEFRAVVILSDLREFTYRETAQLLDIPIGTVRSRLFRARRLLRDALAGYARERGVIREADCD